MDVYHGDVIRVGQRLGRLVGEGKVRVANPKGYNRRYALVENAADA